MRDASDLIRMRGIANVEAEVTATGELIWAVDIMHDHDGYGVMLTFPEHACLEQVQAEDLGLALIRAAATAEAWNDTRARLN